jgi:Ca2+/Na+ antiporter
LPLPFAGFCNALPVVAISYVSAVVHQSQIASSVVQAVAIYMVAFFSLPKLPAQNAFQDLSMQRDVSGTFAASRIKRVVAYRTVPRNSMPRPSG